MDSKENLRDTKKPHMILKNKKAIFKSVELLMGSKRPAGKWSDPNECQYVDFNIKTFKTLKETDSIAKNYSLLTGKINNLSVIDIDFLKDWNQNDKDNHPFIKEFGKDPAKWGCPVIQTPRGGYHLYFNYDKRIASSTSAEHHTDTRSDGGLIVAPYCKFQTDFGEKQYLPIHGNPEQRPDIPDNMFRFITNCGLIKQPKKQKHKIKEGKNEYSYDEVADCDQSLYNYDIPDNILHGLIQGLPDSYFQDYQGWFLFTTAMKQINKKSLWIQYSNSRSNKQYNQEHNEEIYDGIKGHQTLKAIDHLCKNSKFKSADDILSYYKYKPLLQNKRQPDKTINRKHLGFTIFQETIDEHPTKKYFAYKSGTGSGKTTSVLEFIKDTRMKVFSIVSRVSLAWEQYKVFNEPDKKKGRKVDTPIYINDEFETDENYIVQIDSLLKLSYYAGEPEMGEYCLFLDEYNSIIKHLITTPHLSSKGGTRIRIMDVFVRLIQNAKYVFMTDADISDISLELFNQVGQEHLLYIKNEHKPNQGTPAIELFDIKDVIMKMKTTQKWICPCDELRMTEMLYQEMNDDNILLINKNNSGTGKNWDDYDRIIFSPSVIYGLDSIMVRDVFAVYNESTIDAGDMLQQINRNRNIITLHYYFGKKKSNDATYNTLKELIAHTDDLQTACRTNDHLTLEMNQVSPTFKNIYNQIKYNEDCYKTNQFAHARNLMKQRGFKIIDELKIKETDKKPQIKKLKEDKARRINEINKDLPFVKEMNEHIKLPEDEIKNFKQIFIQNDFIQKYNLAKHWIFIDPLKYYEPEQGEYILDPGRGTEDEAIEDMTSAQKARLEKKQEFAIMKYKSIDNKLIFIDDFRKVLNVRNRLKIKGITIPNKQVADKFWIEYQRVFETKTNPKSGNPFLYKEGIAKYMNKMYRTIYDITPFQTTSSSKDGKTISVYQDAKPEDFGIYHKVYVVADKERIKLLQEEHNATEAWRAARKELIL